jgi:hypothetical protein
MIRIAAYTIFSLRVEDRVPVVHENTKEKPSQGHQRRETRGTRSVHRRLVTQKLSWTSEASETRHTFLCSAAKEAIFVTVRMLNLFISFLAGVVEVYRKRPRKSGTDHGAAF